MYQVFIRFINNKGQVIAIKDRMVDGPLDVLAIKREVKGTVRIVIDCAV